MFMRVKYTSVFYIKKFFGVMNSYFLDTQNWKIGFLLKKMSCAFLFFFSQLFTYRRTGMCRT